MHQALSGMQDRLGGGDHHDREYEQRLREIPGLDVGGGLVKAFERRHDRHEHEGPESKNYLHFAQEVQDASMLRGFVRMALELFGRERMKYGQAKDRCGEKLKG